MCVRSKGGFEIAWITELYHSVYFFHSQKYLPRPPGVSTLEDCLYLKMEGASAPEGEVHDGAPPNPPRMCQMLRDHLNIPFM